jgi:5-methyltetrahydrofolate--homocysteine methyltransferase
MVRGYFKCEKSGNNLIVRGEKKAYRFDFPRERIPPHRCLSDFFSDGFAAFQLVTIGSKVGDEISALFGKGGYSESFYLKGFAAEAAEALAKFSHSLIRKELGLGADAGERFSPGYPVFPSLLDQRSIVALLEVRRIGVNLTKTCMLVPEHTTSAIISPDATASRWGSNIIKNRCL